MVTPAQRLRICDRRWCMEVSDDNPPMADFLVTLSPAQLTLLVGGLTAGVGADFRRKAAGR